MNIHSPTGCRPLNKTPHRILATRFVGSLGTGFLLENLTRVFELQTVGASGLPYITILMSTFDCSFGIDVEKWLDLVDSSTVKSVKCCDGHVVSKASWPVNRSVFTVSRLSMKKYFPNVQGLPLPSLFKTSFSADDQSSFLCLFVFVGFYGNKAP